MSTATGQSEAFVLSAQAPDTLGQSGVLVGTPADQVVNGCFPCPQQFNMVLDFGTFSWVKMTQVP